MFLKENIFILFKQDLTTKKLINSILNINFSFKICVSFINMILYAL